MSCADQWSMWKSSTDRHGKIISYVQSSILFSVQCCRIMLRLVPDDTHTVLDRGYLSVARRQSAGALKTIEVCHTLLTSVQHLLFAPGGRSRGLILHED